MQIKSIKEIEAISSLFEISTTQKNQIKNILKDKIKENKKINSSIYITKGIKLIK